jgi:hypothetical protein
VLASLCVLATAVSCSGKKGDTEDRRSVAASTSQQKEPGSSRAGGPAITDISDNPGFGSSTAVSPANETVKDLDAMISPVLKAYFGDARLVGQTVEPSTRADGEVVLESLQYSAKRWFGPEDAKPLHTAFHEAHFGLSPRIGSEPVKTNKYIMMSFFKTSRFKSYSLVIHMTIADQTIRVQSYRLGSKYDRLM